MRHRVDLLAIVAKANGGYRLARAQAVPGCGRRIRRRSRAAIPADRRPAAAPGQHPAAAGVCQPWARRCPRRPCPRRRPASRRGTAAAGLSLASRAGPGETLPRQTPQQGPDAQLVWHRGKAADDRGGRLVGRKPRPCLASAAPALAISAAPSVPRHAFMRARSACFSLRIRELLVTARLQQMSASSATKQ